jgi:hypothetical protein
MPIIPLSLTKNLDPKTREVFESSASKDVLINRTYDRIAEVSGFLATHPDTPSPKAWELQSMCSMLSLFPRSYVQDIESQAPLRETTHHLHQSILKRMEFEGDPALDEVTMISDGIGASSATELSFRIVHAAQGGRIYTIRNETMDLLLETNVDDSLPANMVHAPEDGVVYVELGEKKYRGDDRFSFFSGLLPDGSPETEYLDGFFVDSVETPTNEIKINHAGNILDGAGLLKLFGYPHTDRVRVLAFCFCGAIDPAKENPTNTGYTFSSLYIPVYEDEEQSNLIGIVDLIKRHLQAWSSFPGAFLEQHGDVQVDRNTALLRLSSLILMYIGSSVYREEVRELDEALKRVDLAGTKKKAKRFQQSQAAVNRIYVSPRTNHSGYGNSEGPEGRSVKTHYRKGFIKSQPYGEGWSKRKLVWIKPVIVNASKGDVPVVKGHVL